MVYSIVYTVQKFNDNAADVFNRYHFRLSSTATEVDE
jgi:hypothetical protein